MGRSAWRIQSIMISALKAVSDLANRMLLSRLSTSQSSLGHCLKMLYGGMASPRVSHVGSMWSGRHQEDPRRQTLLVRTLFLLRWFLTGGVSFYPDRFLTRQTITWASENHCEHEAPGWMDISMSHREAPVPSEGGFQPSHKISNPRGFPHSAALSSPTVR